VNRRGPTSLPAPSRLRWSDAVVLGGVGIRARPARSALSALGVVVAIAALVSVLGITASSKGELLAQLGAQGNLLTVAPGRTFGGDTLQLPATAASMIDAIPPVERVTSVRQVTGATVRRSAAVPAVDTGGISVLAAQPSLTSTVSAVVTTGHFLDLVADRYPEVVLGAQAAQTLGVGRLDPTTQVYLAGGYYTVVGVLGPVSVAPELDQSALISFPVAKRLLHVDDRPSRIYLRVNPDQVAAVAAVLPFTASPEQPEAVEVRRPSDILVARLAAKDAYTGLFLALGAVALLVGGVGIANIMVISVVERQGEIGLRRALGARAAHIAVQFLLESTVLAGVGGLLGAALGILATALTAHVSGETLTLPAGTPATAVGVALLVGSVAGLYPAVRAARLAPTDALRAL